MSNRYDILLRVVLPEALWHIISRGNVITDVPAQLTIRLLGRSEVQLAGVPLLLHNQKARALLYYLAATGQSHTRDHLASLLWSESFESNARHSLRSSLYHIRQALHAKGADEVLVGDGDMISLKLNIQDCDVTHFRQLLAIGSESALVRAITLYQGPLLRGYTIVDAPLFEDWLRAEEYELRQAYLITLQHLTALAESREEWQDTITYLQRIVQLDPLSEDMQQRLIGLYLRTGAIGQALRHYRQFETELQQELGLTPSEETQALLLAALTQRHNPVLQAQTQTRPLPHMPEALPFVGRENLLKKLLSLSQAATAGRGLTVLVQGGNGIGKSRLLYEMVSMLSSATPPWIILQGSCSLFDGLLSYGPFLEAFQNTDFGDLTDLLSESHTVDANEQGRFLWRVLQALRTLTRRAPLLLTIEDLQWANSSTLHLFNFLAMRLSKFPVMLVGTVQRVETLPSLQRLVTVGRRHGDVHLISLSPFTQEAVVTLTESLGLFSASANTLAIWLYERSGGSPFILKEIIAQMRAEAILQSTDNGLRLDVARWLRWRTTFTLPETTHDLVAWRLANLSSQAHSLLDILAVANQPLPLALLQEFPGLHNEHLAPMLANLVASGLLVEVAQSMFALPHHLLREALVLPLSHLQQRIIHRQLAAILEKCPILQRNFPLRQVALHAVIGEDVERARRYGLHVLDELVQDNANTQTADFLHHLYDLLAPTASAQEMLRLTHTLGQVHQSLGQLQDATAWLQQYLKLAHEASDLSAQITAHLELGELALVTNNYVEAAGAARTGLASAISFDNPQRIALMARGHRLLGAALAMEGSDLPTAEHHLQEAVTAHRLTDNMGDLCATLFELGNIAAQRGELPHALQLYTEAARTAEVAHVHYFLTLAHNNLAYHNLLLGRLEAAQQALAKGTALAETYEMIGALLHLTSTRGEISLYLGTWEAAAVAFQDGLALSEELGNLERQAGYRAGLALAARGQGKIEDAIMMLTESLTLITDRGYWHLWTRIQLWLAEAKLCSGQLATAESHLNAALTTAQAQGRVLLLLQGERLYARLLAVRGDWPGANTRFDKALERASSLHLPLDIARVQATWGEMALLHAPSSHNGHALLAEAHKSFVTHHAQAELQAMMAIAHR